MIQDLHCARNHKLLTIASLCALENVFLLPPIARCSANRSTITHQVLCATGAVYFSYSIRVHRCLERKMQPGSSIEYMLPELMLVGLALSCPAPGSLAHSRACGRRRREYSRWVKRDAQGRDPQEWPGSPVGPPGDERTGGSAPFFCLPVPRGTRSVVGYWTASGINAGSGSLPWGWHSPERWLCHKKRTGSPDALADLSGSGSSQVRRSPGLMHSVHFGRRRPLSLLFLRRAIWGPGQRHVVELLAALVPPQAGMLFSAGGSTGKAALGASQVPVARAGERIVQGGHGE
jgi:hypothetical protein